MLDACEFDRLKAVLPLLAGEWLEDGWAAKRRNGELWNDGLFLLTSWRVAFVDRAGTFSAAPIAKIHQVERHGPGGLVLSAWHDRLVLRFDPPEASTLIANRLRQDPQWIGACGVASARRGAVVAKLAAKAIVLDPPSGATSGALAADFDLADG